MDVLMIGWKKNIYATEDHKTVVGFISIIYLHIKPCTKELISRAFFLPSQAVTVSVLRFSCTSLTPTKRLEIKVDAN